MNEAVDDAIPLHLSKLLNQHLLGHREEWKRETTVRKKENALPQRRWASSYLRTRALHLSNLFAVLYPDLPNPVLALKDRLPPKSPEVEKAQPMRLVMAFAEQMRTPRRAAHPKQ